MFGVLANQSRRLISRWTTSGVNSVAQTSFFEACGGLSSFWRPSPLTIFQRGKHKTNKSIAKRFRLKPNGTLKRPKSGRQHNTGHKNRQRVNALGQSTIIKNKKVQKKMKLCMGVW
jgi:large subunit ribosomal protein L35